MLTLQSFISLLCLSGREMAPTRQAFNKGLLVPERRLWEEQLIVPPIAYIRKSFEPKPDPYPPKRRADLGTHKFLRLDPDFPFPIITTYAGHYTKTGHLTTKPFEI